MSQDAGQRGCAQTRTQPRRSSVVGFGIPWAPDSEAQRKRSTTFERLIVRGGLGGEQGVVIADAR